MRRDVLEGFRVEFVGEIANMIKIPHGNAAMNIEKCEIAVSKLNPRDP